MTTIKEDQLKLLILILGEECSLLNINTKYFKEVSVIFYYFLYNSYKFIVEVKS